MDERCLIVAILFAIVAICWFIESIPNLRRRRRILDTPTSAIAQSPGQGPVEIKGRVVAGDQGALKAPFSGRDAVWVRAIVEEYRSGRRRGVWRTVIDESEFRPFLVDDGSGQEARVLAERANVVLDTQYVATSSADEDPAPHLEAFLASHGRARTRYSPKRPLRYGEQVVAPGDLLYALGPSRRDAGPPVNEGYRTAPAMQLVLYAGPGKTGELILTNQSEKELVSRLARSFIAAVIMSVVAVAFAIAGVVVDSLE